MLLNFETSGTCSKALTAEIEDGKLKNVRFAYGCTGCLMGIAKLVEGMEVEEIITRFDGINCQNGTSCPDQLAKALKQYLLDSRGLVGY